MTDKNVPTLYEWCGGAEQIEALFKKFYEHVRVDSVLSPIFAEMPEEHFQTVAHFVSEVLGGPKLYTSDGKHNHLTELQRKRWVALLLDTADEMSMPDDPEFRSALVGYLEWGSRIAVINSATTENPVEKSAPMPKWGWGETNGP